MREFFFFIFGAIVASLFFNLPQASLQTDPVPAPVKTEKLTQPPPATPPTGAHHVTKVVDGDTLAVEMNGKSVTIRLIGLDTPESSKTRTGAVECFGITASNKAKEVLAGQSVVVETDPSQDTYDKYGRLLAYVYLPDGTLFNQYMITEGYGYEYTYEKPYTYQTAFRAAQKQAEAEKKGLWADNACKGARDASAESAEAPLFTPAKTYDCTKNTYNCSDFSSHAEAQHVFDSCGGNANDIHKLDSDKDGSVCESLP